MTGYILAFLAGYVLAWYRWEVLLWTLTQVAKVAEWGRK